MKSLFQYFLFILFTSLSFSKQIILSKQNGSIYTLKLDIANLKINLQPVWSLQGKYSWIKSESCKACISIGQKTNQQKTKQQKQNIVRYQEKSYECSQSCFDKSQEQYGLKCIQTHNKCQIVNENVQIIRNQKILKGKLVKVKGQASLNHQKFDEIQIVLVDHIFSLQPSIEKNSLTKQKETKKDDKQSDTINRVGQYNIWGKNTLFESNILTKNTKGEIFIYDGTKENKLEKQILEEAPAIDLEFEQTVTQFSLSQIKLSEKITLNHPEKDTEDRQFPILPLQRGFFTLQSQNLLLPKKQYEKITKYLVETFFSQQKNKCQVKDQKILCEKAISLEKVEYLQLELILNGVSVGFPVKALLNNYKGKSCDLKITPTQSTFAIGTFFLEIFAVEFIKDTENLKLHRLNNQWNKFYSKDEKFHKENFNIFWWMGTSVFYLFYYVLKLVFYLALFSLLINCLYHWRKILEWTVKILKKITRKKGQGQLFEQDEELQPKDTAKLIKKFKNRPNKIFVQDQQSLADEITTQQSN